MPYELNYHFLTSKQTAVTDDRNTQHKKIKPVTSTHFAHTGHVSDTK